MPLCESGAYVSAVFQEQEQRMADQIRILSAHATDIVTGVARLLHDKNKHQSMQKTFPHIFKEPKKKISQVDMEQQTVLAWLSFLGKPELLAQRRR